MTRPVDEWIAARPDQAIPARVKLRIFLRDQGTCYLSGRKIRPGDKYEFDHKIALINGGEHRETNIAVALADAHRVKTTDDLAVKKKIARVAAKHAGTWPKSKTPLRSRGFPSSRQIGERE